MEDTDGSSFLASTSKICWFNLSSFIFRSSTSQQESQQHHHQTPTPSPVRRRTSPRLSNGSRTSLLENNAKSGLGGCVQNHCCLINNSSSSSAAKQCDPVKCCQASVGKNNKNTGSINAGNASVTRRQRQHQQSKDETNECLGSLSEHICCQGRHHLEDEDKTTSTHGLSRTDAPQYLTFNPYITGGYRNNLAPLDCLKSLFWWTNETLNIWSHLLGWVFFFVLTVYDVMGLSNLPKTQPWDQAIFSLLLVCFQACMILSASYHVFCCCSEKSYRQWLTADLLGVSLSLLAIYISGIYYAFSCVPFWLNFYLSTVAAIFVCCLTCTFLRTSDGFSSRLILFGGWACYGIVPTVHWAILHGGMSSPAVALLLPRIFWMYAISAAAFFFYVSKLPERWKPGLVNYIGSSHQIWHVLIVAALYHWHNTGLMYLNFRSQNSCSEEYAALYPTSTEGVIDL